MIERRSDQLGKVLVCVHAVTIQHRGRATRSIERERRWVLLKRPRSDIDEERHVERKVGFIESTAMRHRGSGFREATVASRLTDR